LTLILGISAFYHDSAAALVRDGNIVAAAQEERFTRIKHDPRFPTQAIAYCLTEAGIGPDDLDYVVFYEKPLRKFERLLETYLAYAPRGLCSFSRAIPAWLKEKLFLRGVIDRGLGHRAAPIGRRGEKTPLVFLDHHESHAGSAFFPSPFDEAAILTLDGVGEWTTTACGTGAGNRIQLTHHLQFPHSLGLLYSAFTYYCGFRVNSGEYKLMGLAPYGRPLYADAIYKHLLDLKPDGSFRLNMDYFSYCHGLTMTSRRFHGLFGGPPRSPESTIDQRHADLAASIQAVTEEVLLRVAGTLQRRTGQRKLVLAGGVALNCVANGRLLREGPYDSIWVQPAAGDAGGALGAALFVWHQLLNRRRQVNPSDSLKGSLLGPAFSSRSIRRFLHSSGVAYEQLCPSDGLDPVAELLADGKVVGWFSGRMEFGPRALGARSILADPRLPGMQATLNRKIKFRESFRPFAPSVLQEHAHEWFDIEPGHESPYMLVTASVLARHRVAVSKEPSRLPQDHSDLRLRLDVPRSTIPAVTHVDCSARVQTVDAQRNPRFHRLLQTFHERTGCPVLVNTSFNVRGEPIVCTPEDAYRCFLGTDMDVLILEDCVLRKGAVPEPVRINRDEYVGQFQLD
jgi:carbamoyltransferase